VPEYTANKYRNSYDNEGQKPNSFQAEITKVLSFHLDLDCKNSDLLEVLNRCTTDDFIWRGYHPFGELTKAQLANSNTARTSTLQSTARSPTLNNSSKFIP